MAAERAFRAPCREVPDQRQPLILEDFPMPDAVKVGFVPFSTAPRGILVVFCDER